MKTPFNKDRAVEMDPSRNQQNKEGPTDRFVQGGCSVSPSMEETARTNRSARSTTDDHQPIHKDEPAPSMETHEGDEGVTRGSDQILQRRLIQDAAIRLSLPETPENEDDQDSPTPHPQGAVLAELVASEETTCSLDGGGNLVRMGIVGRPPSSTRYERGDGQPNEEQVTVEMADTRHLTRMQLMRNRAASVVINAEKRSNIGGGAKERRMSQPTEEKTGGPPLVPPAAAGATPPPPYSSLRRHQSDGTILERDASTIRPSLDRQVSLPGAFSIPGPGGGVQGRLGTHEEDILVHVEGTGMSSSSSLIHSRALAFAGEHGCNSEPGFSNIVPFEASLVVAEEGGVVGRQEEVNSHAAGAYSSSDIELVEAQRTNNCSLFWLPGSILLFLFLFFLWVWS